MIYGCNLKISLQIIQRNLNNACHELSANETNESYIINNVSLILFEIEKMKNYSCDVVGKSLQKYLIDLVSILIINIPYSYFMNNFYMTYSFFVMLRKKI